jgi:hypothetical protein
VLNDLNPIPGLTNRFMPRWGIVNLTTVKTHKTGFWGNNGLFLYLDTLIPVKLFHSSILCFKISLVTSADN